MLLTEASDHRSKKALNVHGVARNGENALLATGESRSKLCEAVDLGDHPLRVRHKLSPGRGQPETALVSYEELEAKRLLQRINVCRERRSADVQALGGLPEAPFLAGPQEVGKALGV